MHYFAQGPRGIHIPRHNQNSRVFGLASTLGGGRTFLFIQYLILPKALDGIQTNKTRRNIDPSAICQ
jgi:hypothetical protein